MAQPIMRFCRSCKEYTLKDRCPHCGGPAVQNTPAKFSPEDHYGVYRRKLKQMERGKTGKPSPSPSSPPAK